MVARVLGVVAKVHGSVAGVLLRYLGWLLSCCYVVARVPGWLLGCCYAVARVPGVVAMRLLGYRGGC